MASDGGVDAIDDLKFFILILLGLGFVWYVSGGYDRYKASHSNTASSTSVITSTQQVGSTTIEDKSYFVK